MTDSNFWEASFVQRQAMWGFEPADSAVTTSKLFAAHGVKTVLIPGIGYGRNAKVFQNSGMAVIGIEVAPTAIAIARDHYGPAMEIHPGSVADMPFDERIYDGIFAYGLIHLLDAPERQAFIHACFSQLRPDGYMVFTAVTPRAPMYGKGAQLGPERFEVQPGIGMFFYDEVSIAEEFAAYGLDDVTEIIEPGHGSGINFWVIRCRKPV